MDHTNVNANEQPPTLEDTRDANLAADTAAAAAEADTIEAEAAASNATERIAHMTTET